MGFFDKVTKAVGDAVDKTKKEADQFMRIQRIKGEIGDMERKIAGFTTEIQQARTEAGTRAIDLVRGGHLDTAALLPFADRVSALERAIAEEQEKIAGRRADIERIKAEDDQPKPAAAAPPPVPPLGAASGAVPAPEPAAVPAVPPLPSPPPPSGDPAAPPPLPGAPAVTVVAPETPVCPKCGTTVASGTTFCTRCGEKLA